MTMLWLDRNGTIPVDDFVPDSQNGVIVAGAGTTGLATVLLLTRSGKGRGLCGQRCGGWTAGATTAKLTLRRGPACADNAPRSWSTRLSKRTRKGRPGFCATTRKEHADNDRPSCIPSWHRHPAPAPTSRA